MKRKDADQGQYRYLKISDHLITLVIVLAGTALVIFLMARAGHRSLGMEFEDFVGWLGRYPFYSTLMYIMIYAILLNVPLKLAMPGRIKECNLGLLVKKLGGKRVDRISGIKRKDLNEQPLFPEEMGPLVLWKGGFNGVEAEVEESVVHIGDTWAYFNIYKLNVPVMADFVMKAAADGDEQVVKIEEPPAGESERHREIFKCLEQGGADLRGPEKMLTVLSPISKVEGGGDHICLKTDSVTVEDEAFNETWVYGVFEKLQMAALEINGL